VRALRTTFRQQVEVELAPQAEQLYFLDEMGTHLGLTRLYGRAAPGARVVEATPGYSGPHYTTVAALTVQGARAPFVFEGSLNGPAFETYVEQVLAPTLPAGAVVVLDNLAPHKHAPIQRLI